MSKTQRLFEQTPQSHLDNYVSSAVGQVAHEKIDAFTTRAQEFASEKKEAIYQKFDEAYGRLIDISKNGHWTWQTVCVLDISLSVILKNIHT